MTTASSTRPARRIRFAQALPALDRAALVGVLLLPSLAQGLAKLRFLVRVAAMECVILRDPAPRRWMFGIVAASAAYMALQSVVQFAVGRNLYGDPASRRRRSASLAAGALYTRALAIGLRNPITGLGAGGFRYGCPNPRYFHPTFDRVSRDGGGTAICANHPHNPFMEALVNGSFVGLALLGWGMAEARRRARPDGARAR